MLNGWDVLGIVLGGFFIYEIIEKICMSIVAARAVKQAGIIGKSEDEIYKEVDRIIEAATEHTVKELSKKFEKLNKDTKDEIVKIVDAESKKFALAVEKKNKKDEIVEKAVKEIKKTAEETKSKAKKIMEEDLKTKSDKIKKEVKKTTRKVKVDEK